jgi:hypothetical protein
MTSLRQSVEEFVRAGEALLTLTDLSEEEFKALRDMLGRLSVMFPDEGDDAAD